MLNNKKVSHENLIPNKIYLVTANEKFLEEEMEDVGDEWFISFFSEGEYPNIVFLNQNIRKNYFMFLKYTNFNKCLDEVKILYNGKIFYKEFRFLKQQLDLYEIE